MRDILHIVEWRGQRYLAPGAELQTTGCSNGLLRDGVEPRRLFDQDLDGKHLIYREADNNVTLIAATFLNRDQAPWSACHKIPPLPAAR